MSTSNAVRGITGTLPCLEAEDRGVVTVESISIATLRTPGPPLPIKEAADSTAARLIPAPWIPFSMMATISFTVLLPVATVALDVR